MAWHLSPSSHEACIKPSKQISLSLPDPVNQAFSAAFSPFHATSTNTKRMSTGFSGCPLDIVSEPFHGLIENGWHDTWVLHHMKHASSQANKYLFHCWPSQSRIFRCIFTISWHFYYYQTHFNWLLRVSPWYCQRAISWPHRKWMAWHLSPSSHEACVKTNKQISLSLRTQSIKHFPLHFHHFMPLLLIPNAFQLASQGVPLILSTSHFMASSKMDGMTLESFITWSMRQATQTNISFTADPVNQAFSAACSPFHAIFASTKRMSTGFSGCPLNIVNEPFHGLIENGWHDTWVLHHMKHASSQANKYLFHCWPSQSRIFRCIFTISWHFY